MKPLPANGLRANVGTWAVPTAALPRVAHFLHDVLPNEGFDPHFHGQELRTTYFDTPRLALRKARRKGRKYLTLRLRCYRPPEGEAAGEAYALSAKTEARKWRAEVAPEVADAMLRDGLAPGASPLPGDLLARWLGLVGDEPLGPVVAVCCRRYAVEDDTDRLTLDVGVGTDTGKRLPYAVLEHKSAARDAALPGLAGLRLRPIKLSKFLWATGV
jgi:hypothetical protein